MVAADVRLIEGEILLDQSMLTGESIPIEAGPGLQTYAGALVRVVQWHSGIALEGSGSSKNRPTQDLRFETNVEDRLYERTR